MKSTEKLLSKADRALGRLAVEPGSLVLVGYSGGPDSTALLLALRELSARHGFGVAAAHVDHGIRGTADRRAESECAQALCRLISVPLTAVAIEPGLVERQARAGHRSLEETARAHRMVSLRQAAREQGCSLVALGHTADDQVETMVMRFFQGSGARGLAGIRARAGNVIRPLMECTREEVLAFLAGRGVSCHTDSTNADGRFLRNRIRADLMPALRRVFPGHRAALRSLSSKMSDLADFLDAEMDKRDVWREDGGGLCSADAGALCALPRALRAESLYRVIDKVSPARKRLPYRSIEGLIAATGSQRSRDLGAMGVRIALREGRFVAGRDVVCPQKRGYFSVVEPVVSHAGSYRLSLEAVEKVSGRRSRTIGISGTGVQPPVIVRSRRGGDRLHTAAGTKSLKDLLSQWAVPSDARDDAAIVTDSRGVLAVIALPWGARAADREGASGRGPVSLAMTQDDAGKRS